MKMHYLENDIFRFSEFEHCIKYLGMDMTSNTKSSNYKDVDLLLSFKSFSI
jgi:hypothetical protein